MQTMCNFGGKANLEFDQELITSLYAIQKDHMTLCVSRELAVQDFSI